MEQEISRIETTAKITTIYKYLAYAFVALGALSFIITILVTAIGDSWAYLFTDSSYLIPIFIGVGSLILAVFFFIVDKNVGSVTSFLVLTNKRVYKQVETAKIKQVESYNLNAITYYNAYQTVANKKTCFTLTFKTSTDTAKFIVDEEFYNAFVNAVNGIK